MLPFASVMASAVTGQWTAVHPVLGDRQLHAHKRHSRFASGQVLNRSRAMNANGRLTPKETFLVAQRHSLPDTRRSFSQSGTRQLRSGNKDGLLRVPCQQFPMARVRLRRRCFQRLSKSLPAATVRARQSAVGLTSSSFPVPPTFLRFHLIPGLRIGPLSADRRALR
jgi:hypothetical protein